MTTYVSKAAENNKNSLVKAPVQKRGSGAAPFSFADHRPQAVAQRKLNAMIANSPQAKQAAQLQAMADTYVAQRQSPIQKKANTTGLPNTLKTGIENLSGYSMDDVKVHYNSSQPAQLQAHAYAQGTDIHIGPGQEQHLPHEAWHVVQQKQGRVKPTLQMKGNVNINDNVGLEKEADVMGGKALQFANKPEATVQRRLQETVKDSSQALQLKDSQAIVSTNTQVVQLGRKKKRGGNNSNQGGNKKQSGNKKQQKQKAAKEQRKRRQQSQADRNAFRSVQYETTNKKDVSRKQRAARKYKGNLAHGFGNKNSGMQGKTKKGLRNIREDMKEQKEQKEQRRKKRQANLERDMRNWRNRDDRNDRGGAGFGHGVLVSTTS